MNTDPTPSAAAMQCARECHEHAYSLFSFSGKSDDEQETAQIDSMAKLIDKAIQSAIAGLGVGSRELANMTANAEKERLRAEKADREVAEANTNWTWCRKLLATERASLATLRQLADGLAAALGSARAHIYSRKHSEWINIGIDERVAAKEALSMVEDFDATLLAYQQHRQGAGKADA